MFSDMFALLYFLVRGVVCVSLVLYLSYWYHTKNFDYWEKRGVPFVKPHWFFGNVGHQIVQRKTCTEFARNLYNKFKDCGYGGLFIFRKPAIVICDSKLIEAVLTRDFVHFEDRSSAVNPDEVLSDTLFNASGEKWRQMRHKLIPTFSSAKVKGMFEQVYNCGQFLIKEIETKKANNPNGKIEVEPMAFTFATEVIASCAFGVQLFVDNEEGTKFRNAVDLVFECTPMKMTKMFLGIWYPKLFRLLNVQYIPKTVKEFFINLTKGAIKYRKTNNVKRNDFLQLLISLKEDEEQGKDTTVKEAMNNISEEYLDMVKMCQAKGVPECRDKCFTDNNIASLVFNLLSAGVKPAASTITFIFFELANNPEIQNILRNEVDSCIERNKGLNYEAIKEMTYLEQIIQECHRMYTFTKCLTRKVTGAYKLPGTDLVLEEDTIVYIPLSAIHMDPNFFPEPEKFKPERFVGNNFKPSFSFMPYGNGPRICIGIKFAVLMMKVAIASVVAKYTVESETKLPLSWDNHIFNPAPKDGIWLSFVDRKENHL